MAICWIFFPHQRVTKVSSSKELDMFRTLRVTEVSSTKRPQMFWTIKGYTRFQCQWIGQICNDNELEKFPTSTCHRSFELQKNGSVSSWLLKFPMSMGWIFSQYQRVTEVYSTKELDKFRTPKDTEVPSTKRPQMFWISKGCSSFQCQWVGQVFNDSKFPTSTCHRVLNFKVLNSKGMGQFPMPMAW